MHAYCIFTDNACILYLSSQVEKVQYNWQTVLKRSKTRVCFKNVLRHICAKYVTISYHLKRNYYILIVVDHVKFRSHRTLNQSTLRHSLNLYVTMLPNTIVFLFLVLKEEDVLNFPHWPCMFCILKFDPTDHWGFFCSNFNLHRCFRSHTIAF